MRKTYDSFAIGTGGMFKKFNNSGDPVFAFEPDDNTHQICKSISALFGKNKQHAEEFIVTLSTAELLDGTVLEMVYVHEGTPDWIRSIISDYMLKLHTLYSESQLIIGAEEFPTWYDENSVASDFSDDTFFIIANKELFGDKLQKFETSDYGWKLPEEIPLFISVREVVSEKIVFNPFARIMYLFPFQFSHSKEELYQMCINNEIIISASPTSDSSRFIATFNHIQ